MCQPGRCIHGGVLFSWDLVPPKNTTCPTPWPRVVANESGGLPGKTMTFGDLWLSLPLWPSLLQSSQASL